jgi:flagellar hook-associated protein 1 FlgK
MSGLFSALSSSAQSLSTQSEGVQLAGKNIANSNTEGYSKQRLVIGNLGTVETAVGPQSMGTVASGVEQLRDKYLDAQVGQQISQTSYLKAQDQNLLKAQASLSEQIDNASGSSSITDTTSTTSGIGSSIDEFFNAFSSLAANPSDVGAKQVLLQKADLLANQINVTDDRLESLQSDITSQNTDDLVTVNDLLGQVANLNGQIQKYEVGNPGAAVDLRDQRQTALEKLSQYMDFTTKEISGGNGQIQVTAQDADGNDVMLVDKASVLGDVTYDASEKTFSAGSPSTVLSLTGGSLQGSVDVRDGDIQGLRDSLKNVADQLTTSVNEAYGSGGSGGDFFAASPSSGLIALDSNLDYSTLKTASNGDSGGNDLALAVAAVATKEFAVSSGNSIDGTISGYYSKVASGFGESVASAETKLSDQQTVQKLVTTQRDSVSGVSQDEEMTDLMKYQRGFQASSKVINVIDSLLDTVVNGLISS